MNNYKGDPRALHTIEILLPVLCAGLTIGIVAGVPWLFPFIPMLALQITVGLLIGITLVIMVIWLPLWFRSLSYTITDQCIIKQSGVFFHRQQIILTHALQFSTIIQLPFSRYTGMIFLPLHAYGGTVLLLFLSPADAADICNYLFDHLSKTNSNPSSPEDRHAP